MTEPTTSNKNFIIPLTGDLVGAWGTSALNPNFQNIDGMFGGMITLTPSGATTITLTALATTGVATTTLPQASNALIKFTGGGLTGNAVIKFPQPGFYIVENQCIGTSAFYIQLAPTNGTGNAIGAPPGKKTWVFHDGTHMDYVNPQEVGSPLDLHGATTIPPWMVACTLVPYLVKDGAVYTSSIYPQLAAMLGSTFGGNGGTTFGVPDERGRARIALDTVQVASGATSARITGAIAGFSGNAMGTSGGDQRMQSHTHSSALNEIPHRHGSSTGASFIGDGAGGLFGAGSQATNMGTNTASTTTGVTITNANVGSGSSQNMQPSIVSFLPLIKT